MLYISFFVLSFMSILGIIVLLNLFFELLLDKITDQKVVLNHDNCCKAEYLVRTSLAKNDGNIEVIDDGMSNEALDILARLQNESGRIIISSVKDV